MQAGRLRQRGTIQRTVETDTESGGKDLRFETLAVVACEDVTHIGQTARQFQDAKRTVTTLTHAIEIRYRPDVTASMRFLLGSHVLDIHSAADPTGKRQRLVILCEEVLDG